MTYPRTTSTCCVQILHQKLYICKIMCLFAILDCLELKKNRPGGVIEAKDNSGTLPFHLWHKQTCETGNIRCRALTRCRPDEGRTLFSFKHSSEVQNTSTTHKPTQETSSHKWTRRVMHLRMKEKRDIEKESESESLLGLCLCVGEGTTPNAWANHSIPRRVLKRQGDAVIMGIWGAKC